MIIDVKALRVGVPQDFEYALLQTLPENYGVTAPCPTRVSVRLTKLDGGTITCEGELTAKLLFECGRCLDIVEHEMSLGFHEEIGEIGLSAHGDTIDISPLVEENIILNIPQKVLCGEDCKGLCPVCGANLNVQGCGCERGGNTKLSALKNLIQSENLLQSKGGERGGNLSKR